MACLQNSLSPAPYPQPTFGTLDAGRLERETCSLLSIRRGSSHAVTVTCIICRYTLLTILSSVNGSVCKAKGACWKHRLVLPVVFQNCSAGRPGTQVGVWNRVESRVHPTWTTVGDIPDKH